MTDDTQYRITIMTMNEARERYLKWFNNCDDPRYVCPTFDNWLAHKNIHIQGEPSR